MGLVNRSPSHVAEYVEVDRFHFLRVKRELRLGEFDEEEKSLLAASRNPLCSS